MKKINMLFDQKKLMNLFNQKDYARGQEYYRRGRVLNLKIIPMADGIQAACTVQGSEPYDVSIVISNEATRIYCDCPRFSDKRICKHVAAAMIACANAVKDSFPAESDPRVKSMLQAYVDRTSQQGRQRPENPAKLVPFIHPGCNRNSYPAFSFQVGYDKMYGSLLMNCCARILSGMLPCALRAVFWMKPSISRISPRWSPRL